MNGNKNDISAINMEVIDYYSSFGSFIDRQKNASLGVEAIGSNYIKKKAGNFRSYMPSQDSFFGNDLNTLNMNL